MSAQDVAKAISSARKKRGVAKSSVTRLTRKLPDVEGITDAHSTSLQAQQMLKELESANSNFRTHHLAIIDLVDDEGTLITEQNALDTHDDAVSDISTHLNALLSAHTSGNGANLQWVVSKRLSHLDKGLTSHHICRRPQSFQHFRFREAGLPEAFGKGWL